MIHFFIRQLTEFSLLAYIKFFKPLIKFDEQLIANFWRCAGSTQKINNVTEWPHVHPIFPKFLKKGPCIQWSIPVENNNLDENIFKSEMHCFFIFGTPLSLTNQEMHQQNDRNHCTFSTWEKMIFTNKKKQNLKIKTIGVEVCKIV